MKQNGLARVTEPALYSLNFYFKRWLGPVKLLARTFEKRAPDKNILH